MKKNGESGNDSFDRPMHGLVQVPKAEVEEEERRWQEQRARVKKKGEANSSGQRQLGLNISTESPRLPSLDSAIRSIQGNRRWETGDIPERINRGTDE